MKKLFKRLTVIASLIVVLLCGVFFGFDVLAKSSSDKILDGIYVDEINISGMTEEEAMKKVQDFVEQLQASNFTLKVNDEHSTNITAKDLGLVWNNQEIINEAARLGKEGNIVQRYKALKDLEYGSMIYSLDLSVDESLLRKVIEEKCCAFDIPARDMTLTRENGQFVISGGQTGIEVNVDQSIASIEDFLTNDWNYEDAELPLVVEKTEPRGSEEELSMVKDVLGTYTTSFSTSGAARSANVTNGCSLINGTVLYPGDVFSAYDTIKPFTEENGYKLAGSYLNGMVVESLGGGICQVSTTLYNAVLLSELEVVERHNHSMIISYVKPSMDAAIAESSGKDFKFKNTTEHPIYIEGHTENKNITFTVYGVEYREQGHKVSYESEVLKKTEPLEEKIITTSGQGIGYVDVQSAHIGYVAQLWKIVTEDGVEVSREVINKSTYNPAPRTATVGINTDNPVYAARMQEAVASGSIDQVKAVAGAIKNEIASGATMSAEEQALAAYYQAVAAQQAAAEAAAQAANGQVQTPAAGQ